MTLQDAQADATPGLQEAVRLHEQGQFDQAALRYEALVRADLENFDAMHLLGVLRYQQGRHGEALAIIRTALKCRPASAQALSNLGLVFDAMGRREEALASYDRALALRPGDADALNNRGVALRALKRPSEALVSFEQALSARPGYADALNNRGVALHELGRSAEAFDSFGRALTARPDYREAQENRESVRQALSRHKRADALNDQGNALWRRRRSREALVCYDAAIAARPDFAVAFSNRGNALRDLGRPVDALASYDKALAIRPRFGDALSNRSIVLRDLGRPVDALHSAEAALAAQPDHVDALNNRGLLLHDLGRQQEALASYDRAIALQPQDGDARFNRAMTLLAMGDFRAGWRDYEFRWTRKNPAKPKLRAPWPLWKGEDVAGKRLIIYEEQGLGDVIQFSRFLAPLVARGAKVTFLVRASLHRLLAAAAPAARLVAAPPKDEAFDYQCALMSLPGVLGTTDENLPPAAPYLRAEASVAARWRQRLGDRGFKVGVCWQGNAHSVADVGRSFPVKRLEGVAAIAGVRLISLQNTHGLGQLERLPAGMQLETLGHEFDHDQGAFVHTAAVMSCLDLVITCDTSVAHLAGALGRPVWVALKRVPDWRWMLERSDCPWYPTMTLYRQPVRGDWDAVFDRIAADVRGVRPGIPSGAP